MNLDTECRLLHTQVLLALEQIEQDEELTYEVINLFVILVFVLDDGSKLVSLQHLLVLESNLLRSSLRLHDQHRDMRMDIDNMSYEVIFLSIAYLAAAFRWQILVFLIIFLQIVNRCNQQLTLMNY